MLRGAGTSPAGRAAAEAPLSRGLRAPYVEAGALAGMALGTAGDLARLGPFGLVELCASGNAALFAQLDAHRLGFAGMALGGLAVLVAREGASPRLAPAIAAWLPRLLGMTLGMVAGAAAASVLPARLTFELSLALMFAGMAVGAAAIHMVAEAAARLRPATGIARG